MVLWVVVPGKSLGMITLRTFFFFLINRSSLYLQLGFIRKETPGRGPAADIPFVGLRHAVSFMKDFRRHRSL